MTLAELRSLVRLTLSNATEWPDATLDRWIGAAIRLYSAQYPRRLRATIPLAEGTQAYAVPGSVDVRGLISVEYPSGRVPPRYLACVSGWSDRFGAGGACYAVRGVAEDVTSAVGYIVFAETVQDGESAVVEYWGAHPVPAPGADTTVITVPQPHLEAISAYTEFAAHYELETDEALVADGSTMMLAQLGEESRRAWNRYKEVMDRLEWLGGSQVGSVHPSWGRIGL